MSLPAYCNADAWRPINIPVSQELLGYPDAIDRILDLLHVETAKRYAGKGKDTFCNILAWDVSRAFGAEIPHWFHEADGATRGVGDLDAVEMTANKMHDWLCSTGFEQGWAMSLDPQEARKWASQGRLTLAVWKNKEGPGHVAICLSSGEMCQAGRFNHRRAMAQHCFGGTIKQVKYFSHAKP